MVQSIIFKNSIAQGIVSKEVAKLLKAIGFNEHCSRRYRIDEDIAYYSTDKSSRKIGTNITRKNSDMLTSRVERFSAPRIEDAIKWFREQYSIRIFPTQKICGEFGFDVYIVSENPVAKPFQRQVDTFVKGYETYEEAQNEGILYVLKTFFK